MVRDPGDEVAVDMTIDELARAGGTKVSTLRLYQQRGLLAAPRLVGRTGHYGPAHLARLRTIGALQGRGYSLAAIKELVDSLESGRPLDELLGLEREVAGTPGEWLPMTRAALVARLPGLADAALAERAVALGALRPNPDVAGDASTSGYEVHQGFLAVGSTLSALGVPESVQLDEFARVLAFARDTAARFVGVFEQYLLQPLLESGAAAERIGELAGQLAQLRAAGIAVVTGALEQALNDEAARAIPEYAQRLAAAPAPS